MTEATRKVEEAMPAVLDKPTVCKTLRIAPRTLETMIRDGEFPPPVRLGKRVFWSEQAVAAWHKRLFAAQEAWQP